MVIQQIKSYLFTHDIEKVLELHNVLMVQRSHNLQLTVLQIQKTKLIRRGPTVIMKVVF